MRSASGPRASLLSGGEALAGPGLDELVELAAEASLVNISGHLTLSRAHARLPPARADRHRPRVHAVLARRGPRRRQRRRPRRLLHDRRADRHARLPDPDERDRLAARPAARGARGLAGRPLAGAGPLHDDRHLARAVRADRARRPHLRPQGARVPQVHLPARTSHLIGSRSRSTSTPATAADLELLRGHGWEVVDPRAVAGDPDAFRDYVQGSGGEFSVAQGVYVDTACGWFSDRSTRYLASARPALLQDTGFSRILPVGEGLVAFTTSRRRSRAPPTSSPATTSTPPPRAVSPRSTSRRPSCSPPSASAPGSTAGDAEVVRG